MTEVLASKTCTPCRGGIPPLTREQAELFHAQAPDWQLLEEAHRIERSFRFRNFREALTFVQEIGELAEAEGHHPNISFGWGNATISLQTKKIKGREKFQQLQAASRCDVWFDPGMIARRQNQPEDCSFSARLPAQTERQWWATEPSCRGGSGFKACSPLPRQRHTASAGLRWWRRDGAPRPREEPRHDQA